VQNIVRIRKEHFKDLLDPQEARDMFLGRQVTACWIKHGEIQVKEMSLLAPRMLAEHPNMFLSFAHLGGSVEPRTDSIKRWVQTYGLPKRTVEGQGEYRRVYMLLEDFKEEARCAYRLLKLYSEIQGQEIATIKDRAKNPQTSLDEALRAAFNSRDYRMLVSVRVYDKDEVRLFMCLRVLVEAVNEKLERLRPRLRALSASTVIGSWYCPDLLTAMYLQLYLLIADRRLMRYCDFCGAPFPYRENKLYCNSTCRSRARHQRNADAN
jgi:hypothetical protein